MPPMPIREFLNSDDLLETIQLEIGKVDRFAKEVVDGLNDVQLNWKPGPERWSIAQCLEHLTISIVKFDPYLVAAIERGRVKRPTPKPVAYHPSLMGGWLIRMLVPQATKPVRAPKMLRPADSSSIHDAFGRFLEQQSRFREFVCQTRGVDYNRVRLRSPITPLIRYSLADALVLNVVHTQRHLLQARQVRQLILSK